MRSEDTGKKTCQWHKRGSDSAGRVAGLLGVASQSTHNAQFRGTGINGGGWAVVLADACTTLGSEFVKSTDVSHRLEACATRHGLETCATHLCRHALAGPSTASACCSGQAGIVGGDQPGFVARPGKPVESRVRELARFYKGVRGHGRAHKWGCWWVLSDMRRAKVAIGGRGEG